MTEQQHVVSFVSKYWKLWLIGLIVGLIAGVFFARQLKPSYEGTTTFVIIKNPETVSAPDVYRYDNYYAEQAAVQQRLNLISWLKSPKVVHDIYANAGLPVGERSALSLNKSFTFNETTANTADVIYKTGSESDTGRLGQALLDYTEKNYRPNGYTITATQPLVLTINPVTNLITLGLGLAVALATFLWSLIVDYFSSNK